jgi:hypothetical protein
LGLCSGTFITLIKVICPFFWVPQTGHPAGPLPQLFETSIAPHSATKASSGNIFDFIEVPPKIFAR